MDVLEAILARHSVRDFKSDPIPKETVMKILEVANHTSSGGNGQPWEVFVATGAALERIRIKYTAQPKAGRHPRNQPAYIQERMAVIRNERLKLLGLDPSDPESGKIFEEWSGRMFNTPVLIIVCIDKALKSYFDAGMFMQTICLAAQGYGVDSFIASAFVAHQDVLRNELDIPDSLNIVSGMGLGYANEKSIINTYRSPRRAINDVVRYRD
jgi:nitroreductase